MKKYTQLVIGAIAPAIIASVMLMACGSGKHNTPSGSAPVKQQFVSQTSQSYTPSSSGVVFGTTTTANTNKNVVASKLSESGNSCLTLVSTGGQNYQTNINSTQWWSTATVTVTLTNTCTSAQQISNLAVLFTNLQMNGAAVPESEINALQTSGAPSMVTAFAAGANPLLTISTATCSQYCTGWAEVAAGGNITFNLQISNSGPINSLTLGSASIQGDSPAPIPPGPGLPGTLDVTLEASQLQNLCGTESCNLQVNIISPTNDVVATAGINPSITPVLPTIVQNLLPGTYTLVVVPSSMPEIPTGAAIIPTYAPAAQVAVSSNATTNATVTFQYTTAPTATGSANITLNSTGINAVFNNIGSIQGQLVDTTTKVATPFQITLGGSTTVNQLVIGHSYTLSLQGLGDPQTGTYYQSITNQTVAITNATPVAVPLQYSNASVPTTQVAFSEKGAANANITLAFGSNNQYYKYNTDNITFTSGATQSLSFPTNDPVAVTITGPAGYNITSGNPVIVNSGGTVLPVTITLAPITQNGLMVGYLTNSYGIGNSIYTTISQAAQAGYNVVVVAFAVLQNTTPMTWYGNQFLAYTSWQTFSACPAAVNVVVNDIQNAKKLYGLKYALASVGGQNSTFSMTNTSPTAILQMAQNVVSFVNQYGLDGIDFDIEQQVDGNSFAALVQAIRNAKPGIIISAAPQAFSTSQPTVTTDVAFVTTGSSTDYNAAFQAQTTGNILFNFLWLQAYNTGSTQNQIMYNGQLVDETMAQYIPASFLYFTGQLTAQPVQPVPAGSIFLIGEPSQVDAAGTASVWHNPSYANATATYQAMASAYTTLTQLPQPQQAQFGGAMTWSINQDIDAGCNFASKIGVVFGITSITCPTNGTTYHGTLNPNNC